MSTGFEESVQALWDLHMERTEWTVKEIIVEVQTSLQDETPMEVNVVETIGARKAAKRNTVVDDFYWLPSNFNQNTAKFRDEWVIPRTLPSPAYSPVSI